MMMGSEDKRGRGTRMRHRSFFAVLVVFSILLLLSIRSVALLGFL